MAAPPPTAGRHPASLRGAHTLRGGHSGFSVSTQTGGLSKELWNHFYSNLMNQGVDLPLSTKVSSEAPLKHRSAPTRNGSGRREGGSALPSSALSLPGTLLRVHVPSGITWSGPTHGQERQAWRPHSQLTYTQPRTQAARCSASRSCPVRAQGDSQTKL